MNNNGQKKIPQNVLQALVLAQAQAELAQERFLRRRAEVELEFGFRFADSDIAADGTVTPRAPAPQAEGGA